MNDLAAAYSACVRGEQPSLPPLPATYAAYAAWQHAQAEQGAWDADLEYWSSRLLGAPSYLALPYRKAGGGGTAAAAAGPGAAVPLFLPRDVVAGLSALAGRGGTTLFSVLAAAVSALLMRYADQEDVTLGIPFSGREAGPAPLLRQVGAGLMGVCAGLLVRGVLSKVACVVWVPSRPCLLAAGRSKPFTPTSHSPFLPLLLSFQTSFPPA
jgi:hypothetical protein